MGRTSVKENKNIYQISREDLGLSREKASELLGCISPERIERIETNKNGPHPDEVLLMSQKYKKPSLCNHYCSNECSIGKQYVPKIEIKELSAIILEMLASLNSIDKKKDRLIEITADGKIDTDEINDFVQIQKLLEQVSITVETLQLWVEKMLAQGDIDINLYNAHKDEKSI